MRLPARLIQACKRSLMAQHSGIKKPHPKTRFFRNAESVAAPRHSELLVARSSAGSSVSSRLGSISSLVGGVGSGSTSVLGSVSGSTCSAGSGTSSSAGSGTSSSVSGVAHSTSGGSASILGGVSSSVGSAGSGVGSVSSSVGGASSSVGGRSRSGSFSSRCRCGSRCGLFLLATSGQSSSSDHGSQDQGVLHISSYELVQQTYCVPLRSAGQLLIALAELNQTINSTRGNYREIPSMLTNTDKTNALSLLTP